MYLQNFPPAIAFGDGEIHFQVKATGATQGRIDTIGTVSGCENHHPIELCKAIH